MAYNWKEALKPVMKSKTEKKLTPAQKLADNMDKALAAFKAGNEGIKRPVIKQEGNDVHFTIRYANKAIELAPGISTASVAAAKFEQVYGAIKASVLAGEFDKALEPLAAATAARGARLSASKKKSS